MRSFFSVKIAIIIFWIAVLGLFLLLPSVSSLIWYNDKTLNLFTWTATIDPKFLKNFEKKTGIKVNITYFESNEELFVKLFTTKGKGYDLIMPSDYLMEKLIKYNLIKSLDKKKLNFWDRINPRLLDHYFDPGNNYSIPYFWAIYGLGINKDYFKEKPPASWSLLFDYPVAPAKIAMLNVAREAMLITSQYLYGSIESITTEKIKKIKEKLIKQKPRVETYIDADIRANYLLASDTCPVVVATTPYILQLISENKAVEFLMPQEGSFILIDNLVISSACKKDELVYQLINYLYDPEVVQHHYDNYPFLPVTNDLKELMEADHVPESLIAAHFDRSLQLEFFKNVIPEKIVNEVWIAVKTS